MSGIKIDKDVPIPGTDEYSGKYPFGKMEVGDSFYIELEGGNFSELRKIYHKLYRAASTYIKITKSGSKFKIRTDIKGVRIWRVA